MPTGTLSLGLLLSFALAQSDRGPLQFERTTLDLGEHRAGAPATCTFHVRNTGAEPVDLVDLERSCGCIAPRWQAKTLQPGEAGSVTLLLRTLGQKEGPRTWPMALRYRSRGMTYREPLVVQAAIRNELVLEPPQLALYVQRRAEQRITLVDRRESPLQLDSIRCDVPGVRIERKQLDRSRTELTLSVDAADLPPGRHEHVLHLQTNDPVYPDLEVPLTLVREEDRPLRWSPELPEIVVAPDQKRGSVLLRLTGATATPLTITKAQGNEEGMTCTWAAAADGSITMRIAADRATYPSRALQAAVHVETPAGRVSIPVLVHVE